MNEAFEKILERLEALQEKLLYSTTSLECEVCIINAMEYSKKIVQEVAEEYKRGWIPCSERLPEPYTLNLVCEKNGEIHLCRYHNGRNRYFYDGSDWDIKESEVIAWKPLPEPYKDNKNE